MSTRERLGAILTASPDLGRRFSRVKDFGALHRASEYHLTNACNIRCKGCWFYEFGHDQHTKEEHGERALVEFIQREKDRGINNALLIGGEPTLFPKRIEAWARAVPFVTVSTNGLVGLPRAGFENVAMMITLFGGGPLDDELRGISPRGRPMKGLLQKTLANYRDDPRATYVYAVTESGIRHVEETVRAIGDAGGRITFNYYSAYHQDGPLARDPDETARLLDEILRVRDRYPSFVISTPYYMRTLVTGRSHWESFGYHTCPSISADHPAHEERRANGNRTLPMFNSYAADLRTVNFCCTSGHCGSCRDSQAVSSWLLVSLPHFCESAERLTTWLDHAEAYWGQFIWSPFHPHATRAAVAEPPRRAACA